MPAIEVRGIREVQSAFRKVDKDLPGELREEFRGIAETVVAGARAKVTSRSGRAAASIRPRASQRGAAVAFGGNAAPYFPWLDFGGSVGRGHRPGKSWSGSVRREWRGRPVGDGRYVYPTIEEHRADIEQAAEDAVMNVARKAGLETD